MKKAMRVLLAGFLACAALCGCGKETSGRPPVTLYEVAHSIFYAPQYAAIELGYFQEEGIDLTLVNGAGADKVMTAMLAGDADIGFMGSEASIYTYAQGGGLCSQFCAAASTRRKLSGCASAGSGFHLAEIKGQQGVGRTCRRYAADGL